MLVKIFFLHFFMFFLFFPLFSSFKGKKEENTLKNLRKCLLQKAGQQLNVGPCTLLNSLLNSHKKNNFCQFSRVQDHHSAVDQGLGASNIFDFFLLFCLTFPLFPFQNEASFPSLIFSSLFYHVCFTFAVSGTL